MGGDGKGHSATVIGMTANGREGPAGDIAFYPKVQNILPHPWLHLKLPKLGGSSSAGPAPSVPLSFVPVSFPTSVCLP